MSAGYAACGIVPEAVRSDALRDAGPTHRIRDLPLHR
jgi:hypothetical protein